MPAKIFQAQLENLFSNNSLAEVEAIPAESSTFPGWMWECDQRGNITFCSPEIEQALGIHASEVIAQNLLSHRLSPESAKEIAAVFFRDSDQPKNMLLSYQHRNGAFIPVNLYILGTWINGEGRTFVRGFSQLQQFEEAFNSTPETKTLAEPIAIQKAPEQAEPAPKISNRTKDKQRKIEIASLLITEMLNHLKKTTQEIRNAQTSRIVTTTEEQIVEDISSGNEKIQVLFGKRIATFQSITITQRTQRLEWGQKLELTDAEVEFLKNNQHQNTGLFARFRNPITSKIILKADKSWFEATIQTEGDKPPKIIIQYEQNPDLFQALDVDEFIADPLTLMPSLRKAVEHPFQQNEVLVRGVDFLIPL